MTSLNKWRGATDGRSGGCARVCVYVGWQRVRGGRGALAEIEVWRGKNTWYVFFILFCRWAFRTIFSAQHQQTQENQPHRPSLTPSLTPTGNSTPSHRSACRSLSIYCQSCSNIQSGTNTDKRRKAPQFSGGLDGGNHLREAFRVTSLAGLGQVSIGWYGYFGLWVPSKALSPEIPGHAC